MKFRFYDGFTDWKWLYIIPTVNLIWNEPMYTVKTFRVSIHWLGWHLSWLWIGIDGR